VKKRGEKERRREGGGPLPAGHDQSEVPYCPSCSSTFAAKETLIAHRTIRARTFPKKRRGKKGPEFADQRSAVGWLSPLTFMKKAQRPLSPKLPSQKEKERGGKREGGGGKVKEPTPPAPAPQPFSKLLPARYRPFVL